MMRFLRVWRWFSRREGVLAGLLLARWMVDRLEDRRVSR